MAQSEHAKLGREFLNLARSELADAARSRTATNVAVCVRAARIILKLALAEYEKEMDDEPQGT